MKKLLVYFAVILALGCMISGCVPKEEASKIEVNPDFVPSDTVELDFVELHNDAIENLQSIENGEPYIFITDIDISGDNEKMLIDVKAMAREGATKEDADSFASAILRMISDAAAVQNLNLEAGDTTSFGTVYDYYNLLLNVYSEADNMSFYTLAVAAEDEIPLDPNYEKYVDEWIREKEVYLGHVVYDTKGNIIKED